MKRSFWNRTGVVFALLGMLAASTWAQSPNTFTVYASGLDGPRGLRFGPDGALYVAEAGTGGMNATGTACAQVVPPIGPYTGGKTARISKIVGGNVVPVAIDLPSAQDAIGDVMGVSDIAFLKGKMYALLAGGGCSHGNSDVPNGVVQVDPASGKWSMLADLGRYIKLRRARYESVDDFEPDGTFYGMVAAKGALYVVEANHGQVLSVSPGGAITQVIDISASEGHIVPTSIAERNDLFYVGNLNLFPIDPQWARILAIGEANQRVNLAPGFGNNNYGWRILNSTAGFTTVVAVDFGPDGLLYALELSTAAGNPMPGTGKVVRVDSSGDIEDVITGLTVPTGMTFGPDGALYVSNLGAAPPGAGQILRFSIDLGF